VLEIVGQSIIIYNELSEDHSKISLSGSKLTAEIESEGRSQVSKKGKTATRQSKTLHYLHKTQK
jgi:hypothetical protein